jgi:hypothetical protein
MTSKRPSGNGAPDGVVSEKSIEGEIIISFHAGYETNGAYTDAFLARPADGLPRPGVVLLSGMFGLTWTQREITRYYARQGFVALSPNYVSEGKKGDRAGALRTKNSLDVEGTVASALVGGADAQFAPDADLPPQQRRAADLSFARSFEFFHRELESSSAGRYSPA